MKFQTFIAVVASVGVVATAASVGGVGADVGVPSTGDIVSSAEGATTSETSEQTATPTATPEQTETPSSESDPTDAEPSSSETESSDSESTATDSTTTASESESTGAESSANETAQNETAGNNTAPVAAASADAMVHERTRVELDAGDSRDPDGDELNYTWTQISGPDAELSSNNTSSASFVSPDVAVWTDVTFRVTVTDAAGANDTANVTVTVRSTDYPEPADSGGESRSDSADESDSADASANPTRDEISRTLFDAEFDALDTEDAVYVEELYQRHPSGEWNATDVRSRDAIARDRYNRSFDELAFDARVDVQETFDAQFNDTGENATYSRDELTQAQWGYNFSDVSGESAGRITELYDRQPFAEDRELDQIRTREGFSRSFYYEPELANLTREQRLRVERAYHAQFAE